MELINKKKFFVLIALIFLLALIFNYQIGKNFRLYLANILNPYKSTLEFTINENSHNFEAKDEKLNIKWQGTNVALCVASSDPEIEEWLGEQDIKGIKQITINTTTKFTLTCAGPGGLIAKEISVNLISKKEVELKPIFKKIEFQKVEERKEKEEKKIKTIFKKAPVKITAKTITPEQKITTSLETQILPAPSLSFKINNAEKDINIKPDEKITIIWEAKNVNKCLAFSSPLNNEWRSFIDNEGSKTIEKINQNTLFGIFCTYARGYLSKSINVNVYIPNPLKVEIKANDQSDSVLVPYNSNVTLAWSTENAEKCEAISNPEIENWKGEIPLSGKRSTANLTKDTKFTIRCFNKYQTLEKTIEAKIIFVGVGGGGAILPTNPPSGGGASGGNTPPPSISVNLKVNNQEGPISVNKGENITLSWSSNKAKSCTVSASPYYPEWSGFKEPQGSVTINLNKGGTTTFSISCVDENGNDATDQVIVYVKEIVLNKFVDLKVNGQDNIKINKGNNINVKWTSNEVTSCTVSANPPLQGWSGTKPTSGETTLGPINAKTTLSISCIDEAGNDYTDQAVIDVE